ncbi:hypothetical protein P879_03278 [Paragonimus westermani]|uniref:Uncharacterized protein n=1 Tax=Paragonimus westermani TaxID=34504 RepID=A0A8T0DTW6_9TREM|nr:hypothetical protein P879_03278 [Paragonimus westermani]
MAQAYGIEVNRTSSSYRYTWLTLISVATCVVLIVTGLSLIFRESVLGHLCKTSHWLKKSSRDIFEDPTTECCKLQESGLSSAFSCTVGNIESRKTKSDSNRILMDFNPNYTSFIHRSHANSPSGSILSSSTLQMSPYPIPGLPVFHPDSSGVTTIFNNNAVDWIANSETTNMLAWSGNLSTSQPTPVVSNNGCFLNNSLEQCNGMYLEECPSTNADIHAYSNAKETKHMNSCPFTSAVAEGDPDPYRDTQSPADLTPDTGFDLDFSRQTVQRNFSVHAQHLGQSVYQNHCLPTACGICELTSSYIDHNSIAMNHCDYWKHAKDYIVHWYPSKQGYNRHFAVDSQMSSSDARYQSPMVKQNKCFVSREQCLRQLDHMGDYNQVFTTGQHCSMNGYQTPSFANTSTLDRNHLPAYKQTLRNKAWDGVTCVDPFQPVNDPVDPEPKCLSHTAEGICRYQNSIPVGAEQASDQPSCPIPIKYCYSGIKPLEEIMNISTSNRNEGTVTNFRPSSHFNGWTDSKSNEEIGLTEV